MTTPKTQSAETQPSELKQISTPQLSMANQTAAIHKQSDEAINARKQFEDIKAALRGPTPKWPLPRLNPKAAATEPAINQSESK